MTLTNFDKEDLFLFRKLGFKACREESWTDEELADCYKLVNVLYEVNESDGGCSGCRRATVNLLRQAYLQFYPQKD